MVVRKDHGGSVVRQCALDHFARIHAGLAERAVEQLFRGDHAMLGIKEQHQKNFLLPPAQQELQKVTHRTRRIERVTALQFLL